MNKKEAVFLLLAIYLQVAVCKVIDANTLPPTNDTSPFSEVQIIRVTINNNIDSDFEFQYYTLHWGSWSRAPRTVGALRQDEYVNQASTPPGLESEVVYKYRGYGQYGTFKIYTNVDNSTGKFNHRLEYSREFGEFFNIKLLTQSLYNLVISLDEKMWYNFNVFISGDPQPYRSVYGSITNENWERENRAHADKILEKHRNTRFRFGIINGNIADNGRKSQRESFERIYASRLPFNLFLGLGAEDYENNINDCWDGEFPNENGCAVGSVMYMNQKLNEYKSILNNYRYDFEPYTGSMAYRFDYANYTFIQLQNYPSYEREFTSEHSVKIRSSLQWLRQELINTNKNVILNLHDMDRYYRGSDPSTDSFKEIINTFNVKLIFAGSVHLYRKYTFGTATVFVSHALFDGGYFRVTFKDNCATVYTHNDKNYGVVCFN